MADCGGADELAVVGGGGAESDTVDDAEKGGCSRRPLSRSTLLDGEGRLREGEYPGDDWRR